MKPKASYERILPLNPDLERAVLYAVMNGKMEAKAVSVDELSKLGRTILKAMGGLSNGKSVLKPKTVFLAATELHRADPGEVKQYIKDIASAEIPEIQSIITTLARKRIINSLVNEASDQVASGEYSLLALKSLMEKHGTTRNALVPLLEEMGDSEGPPQGEPLPCLPRLAQAVGGVYGVWVVQGEPAAGKSTLALQVAMSVGRRRPVLYYDFEQGTGVIKWHISKALCGDKQKIKEATHQMYIRHSMSTMESDLEMIGQPCLVVVDSIQKVASSVTYRRESLEAWVHKLEALKKYGHHVIMVSEKRRGTYGEARLDGGKETGELEYSADTALDLLLPNEEDGSTVSLHITKNRHYTKKGYLGDIHRTNSWWFQEAKSNTREVD